MRGLQEYLPGDAEGGSGVEEENEARKLISWGENRRAPLMTEPINVMTRAVAVEKSEGERLVLMALA